MTFRGIVWKNFKFGIRKYTAFFLCSSFAIAIFFIFCNLSFSREIIDFMKKPGMGSEYIFSIMVVTLSIFSIGFISYINRSKNKSRSKEFGLYMTMGMSYRDITRLIILEDTVITGASIVSGMLVGMIFSKLFYMINMRIIGEENGKFVLDYRSFLLTAGIFIIIYSVNILITKLLQKKMNIRNLMTSDRESEYIAKSHGSLAGIGIVMMIIFASTSIAAALSRDIAMKTVPVVLAALTGMVGIYLVISNITGILSGAAKKNKKLYGKSLLYLSELKYTSQKNTNVLFLLSLLSGMILLCSASTIALLSISGKIVDRNPQPVIAYIEAMGVNKFEDSYVEELVRQSKAGLKEHLKYPCTFANEIVAAAPGKDIPICIISKSTLLEMTGDRVEITGREAEILAADPLMLPAESSLSTLEITNGILQYKLDLKGNKINSGFKSEIVFGNRFILIVADALYEELAGSDSRLNGIIHHLRVDSWRKTGTVFDKLNSMREDGNPLEQHFIIAGDYASYVLMKHLYSTIVFIESFISILFFAATVLILLFRQYEGTEKMAGKYSQLRKLGLLRKEFKKFINAQTRYLFVVPLVFGLFVGACMMLIIQSLMGGNDLYGEFWSVSIKVAALYILLQLVFCKAVSENYTKRIISRASVK